MTNVKIIIALALYRVHSLIFQSAKTFLRKNVREDRSWWSGGGVVVVEVEAHHIRASYLKLSILQCHTAQELRFCSCSK